MPIVDIDCVTDAGQGLADGLARRLADALAGVWNAAPGRVWVRLHELPAARYAENAAQLSRAELPVFVRVLQARSPQGEERVKEAQAISAAVSAVVGRPTDRIHVEYAPDGQGRIAFGGRLVR